MRDFVTWLFNEFIDGTRNVRSIGNIRRMAFKAYGQEGYDEIESIPEISSYSEHITSFIS